MTIPAQMTVLVYSASGSGTFVAEAANGSASWTQALTPGSQIPLQGRLWSTVYCSAGSLSYVFYVTGSYQAVVNLPVEINPPSGAPGGGGEFITEFPFPFGENIYEEGLWSFYNPAAENAPVPTPYFGLYYFGVGEGGSGGSPAGVLMGLGPTPALAAAAVVAAGDVPAFIFEATESGGDNLAGQFAVSLPLGVYAFFETYNYTSGGGITPLGVQT